MLNGSIHVAVFYSILSKKLQHYSVWAVVFIYSKIKQDANLSNTSDQYAPCMAAIGVTQCVLQLGTL